MKTLFKHLKRYKMVLISGALLAILLLFWPHIGSKAVNISFDGLKEMALVIPPTFVLLGFLDVWVPKETIVRYMGESSGLTGITLAILLGSASAGPLYGAFPIAAVFMKKGVKFSNIMIFMGAWSTTKIPMLLFEISSLGWKFALTRLLVDIPGIIIIGYILNIVVDQKEKNRIYQVAERLSV